MTRRLGLAVAFCIAAAAPAIGVAKPPSSREATAVVQASEDAARQLDVQKSVSFMSDDCVIVSYWLQPDGSKKEQMRLNVKAYTHGELETKKHARDDVYESSPPTIKIEGDRAIARFHVTEKVTLDGRRVETAADQIEYLEMRGDKVQITYAETTAVSLMVDGTRVF